MMLSTTIFLALAPTAIASTGIDPIDNYCWRIDHQCLLDFSKADESQLIIAATVKNGTLYIDGGVEVFADENNNGSPKGDLSIGYTTSLIAVDMSTSWNWKTNISMKALNKTANPSTGTVPPLVVDAALYSGPTTDTSIYLYGGTISYVNTSFPGYQDPTSSQYALWSYDTAGDEWSQYDVSLHAPNRPAGGAYAEASDQGLAFWLNGYINNGTSNTLEDWDGLLEYLDGLIVVDTNKQTATNVSTSSLKNFPRVKGGLTYIPGVGEKGILVSLGGVTKSTSDTTDSNQGSFVSFGEVDIFDLASLDTSTSSGTWYTQKTTLDIPDGRTDFCVLTATAQDNSSHNIYIYGGKDSNHIYDQIYVLSLPSFTWTRVYEGESPRYGHTCHLVGNRQMLTVGGSSTTDLMAACDWEMKGVAVCDVSRLNWGSVYNVDAGEYEVPAEVYRTIGGDETGNATMQSPSNGFNSPEIGALFDSKSTTTNNKNKNRISGGAVAGAVVGSVAGAALLAALIFLAIWWKKRQILAQGNQPLEGEGKDADISTGAVWRNRDGWRAELPNSQVPGEYQYQYPPGPGELHGQPREIHEAPADPVGGLQEMEATEVRHEMPSSHVVEKD